MPQLTEATVLAHVGQRSMRRVRWYDVDDPIVQGETLLGRVAGFQVQAELEPLTTRCSCLYRQRCDHAAVLLMAWLERPERFRREEVADIALPADPARLLHLLENEHAVLLDSPIEDFVREVPPGHPLQHRMLDRLETVLREGSRIDVLLPALGQRIERRNRRLEAIERAREWRLTPPEEDVLAPLYEACREVLDETDLHAPPGQHGRVSLGEAETLVFRLDRLPHHPVTVPIQVEMLEAVSPLTRKNVAAIVLDAVVGRADPELRAEVLEVLGTPLWQRSLAQLDAALALVGPRDQQQIGWRVEGEPQVERVVPVQLTPYKRRSGYRTKKLAPSALAELERAADRATLGALRAKAALPMVLEQLVEHPAVVDESGELLHVRYGELAVVVHESAGWRVELRIDDRTVEPSVLAGLRSVGGLGAIKLGSSVFVLRMEPVVEGLIGVLDRFGDRFPMAARKALVERLQVLESAVPLQLGGTIRGEEQEIDLTPELRLVPLSDGALRVELRVRPLPEGPPFQVGEGPTEVSRVVDGRRLYVRRRPLLEPERVRQRLADLPLPTFRDGSGTVDDPNQALELVWQLRQRDDIRVVWPQQRLSVRNEVRSLRVGITRRHDWFGLEGETEGSRVSLKELLAAVRAGRNFVPVDERAWLRITVELQEALKLLATSATDEDVPRVPALAASRALLSLESAALTVDLPDELLDLEDRIRAASALEPRPTPGLNAVLRPYQLEGVTWLRRLRAWAPGAILADEMGLGKTLQALALILETGGRALVVAPASVGFNWLRESQRFAPDLPAHLYRGPDRAIEGEHGVWITSYELLVRDLPTLGELRFDTVVFDEAQALKNPLTQRSRAARSLDAAFVLALSGTPVENHLLELWSLLRVVAPGLLGPREHFLSRYGVPLMEGGEQLAGGRLSDLLQPFLLRRTKRAVAPELPEREETVEYVELDAGERVVYERFRKAAVGAIQSKSERMQVLAALTRLRQIACAARLVDADAPAESSKIRRLCERCDEARSNGEQVLVFSQFTGLLDLTAHALVRRGMRVLRLDGRTPMSKRREAVDSFQAGGADVFLIALKAGGTGLNLTAATTVILLDPWWNPAAEDQAADRAHRIGQDTRVQVIRLVSAGTVEEQVLALHAEKRRIAEHVLEGAEVATTLGADDLIALLTNAGAAGTP